MRNVREALLVAVGTVTLIGLGSTVHAGAVNLYYVNAGSSSWYGTQLGIDQTQNPGPYHSNTAGNVLNPSLNLAPFVRNWTSGIGATLADGDASGFSLLNVNITNDGYSTQGYGKSQANYTSGASPISYDTLWAQGTASLSFNLKVGNLMPTYLLTLNGSSYCQANSGELIVRIASSLGYTPVVGGDTLPNTYMMSTGGDTRPVTDYSVTYTDQQFIVPAGSLLSIDYFANSTPAGEAYVNATYPTLDTTTVPLTNFNMSASIAAVPEPGIVAIGAGACSLLTLRKRRRTVAA